MPWIPVQIGRRQRAKLVAGKEEGAWGLQQRKGPICQQVLQRLGR